MKNVGILESKEIIVDEDPEEEIDEEEDYYDRNITNPNEKTFEKTKEDALKAMASKNFANAIDTLNQFFISVERTNEKNNANLVVKYDIFQNPIFKKYHIFFKKLNFF